MRPPVARDRDRAPGRRRSSRSVAARAGAARAGAARSGAARAVAAWGLAALGLAACSATTSIRPAGRSSPTSATPGRRTTTTAAPATTTTLPVRPVAWSPCQDGLQCGTVTVPVDYARPDGPTIAVALARHPAEDPASRLGAIVVNPGGPGGSGVDDLVNELGAFTPELLDRFDIVSFDPRGVGRSDPVTCGEETGGTPGPLPDPVPSTASQQQQLVASDRSFAEACERADGALLPYLGTVDVARDLDRIRAALGEPSLTYVGQSYGTLLGAVYAELFPTHVRAMVLDGAIDPALSLDQLARGQAAGFESSFDAFASWCAADDCPWHPDGSATAAVLALVAAAAVHRLPAEGGRSAGPGEIYDALFESLYGPGGWPALGQALAEAAAGSGDGVLALSDRYLTANSANAAVVSTAINCEDHAAVRQLDRYPAIAAADGAVAPVFGPLLAWGEAGCAVWPVPATLPTAPIHAPGTPPIVVVGTTGDPATPYRWAVGLAGELDRGVLVTRDGDSHVAAFSSACVRQIMQDYLVTTVAPVAGTVCPS